MAARFHSFAGRHSATRRRAAYYVSREHIATETCLMPNQPEAAGLYLEGTGAVIGLCVCVCVSDGRHKE